MNCRITETDYSLKVTLLLSANQIFPSPLPHPLSLFTSGNMNTNTLTWVLLYTYPPERGLRVHSNRIFRVDPLSRGSTQVEPWWVGRWRSVGVLPQDWVQTKSCSPAVSLG